MKRRRKMDKNNNNCWKYVTCLKLKWEIMLQVSHSNAEDHKILCAAKSELDTHVFAPKHLPHLPTHIYIDLIVVFWVVML
jgi:hypothetical protein